MIQVVNQASSPFRHKLWATKMQFRFSFHFLTFFFVLLSFWFIVVFSFVRHRSLLNLFYIFLTIPSLNPAITSVGILNAVSWESSNKKRWRVTHVAGGKKSFRKSKKENLCLRRGGNKWKWSWRMENNFEILTTR